MITIKSKGIRRNKYLDVYFGSKILEDFSNQTTLAAVWGIDKNEVNKLAEKEAKERDVPILRLEDGIFRSYGLEDHSYSLYKSMKGIYYNSLEESNLEELLNSDWQISKEENDYYELCLEMIIKYNISKYNDGIDFTKDKLVQNGKKNILLIDQTFGDKSIEFGMASAADFSSMFKNAMNDFSNSNIYVKIHPEVYMGKKQGYLLREIEKLSDIDKEKIILIKENENAPSVISYMDEIHVVTSQVGFDALLRGKTVICYGVPFYANWGATIDFKKTDRRIKNRSVGEIFTALAIKLTEYVNPFTEKKGELLDVLEYISLQKRHKKFNELVFYNTKLWKKTVLNKFLGVNKSKYIYSEESLSLARKENKEVATWGYAEEKNKFGSFLCIEDGFIRSSGLGSDIEAPLSLVVDKSGIYFNPKKESDLEKILNNEKFTKYELLIGQKIIKELIDSKVTKYNVGTELSIHNIRKIHEGKKIILVVGQVEGDASILLGSVKIKNDYELLEKVSELRSGEVIVYKPHPDILSGNRSCSQSPEENMRILKENFPNNIYYMEKDGNIIECFNVSDEVHVITSTAGLEAILREKKVFTYGLPFYGGYGLTNDHEKFHRERRKVTKEELIFACYGVYPRYKFPKDNAYTNALSVIRHLSSVKNKKINKTIINKIKRKVKLCIKTIQALV